MTAPDRIRLIGLLRKEPSGALSICGGEADARIAPGGRGEPAGAGSRAPNGGYGAQGVTASPGTDAGASPRLRVRMPRPSAEFPPHIRGNRGTQDAWDDPRTFGGESPASAA